MVEDRNGLVEGYGETAAGPKAEREEKKEGR